MQKVQKAQKVQKVNKMRKNILLIMQYEGTRYHGWQKQTSPDYTIQGKLEALLGKLFGEPVQVYGSGRTDAGVHAMGQAVNFHTESRMPLPEMLSAINHYLPDDIAAVEIREMPERFHSRLHAKGKCYCYQVLTGTVPDVFRRRYALEIEEKLDVEAMRKAASWLVGEHDFKSFTSAKKGKKSTIRRLDEIRIEESGKILRFWFRGDGFLYHMVRILMGTLLEVGRGERDPDSIPELINARNREIAGYLVPAKGLTLIEVYF